MEIIIPPEQLKKAIKEAVIDMGLVPKSTLVGRSIGIDEFRKNIVVVAVGLGLKKKFFINSSLIG